MAYNDGGNWYHNQNRNYEQGGYRNNNFPNNGYYGGPPPPGNYYNRPPNPRFNSFRDPHFNGPGHDNYGMREDYDTSYGDRGDFTSNIVIIGNKGKLLYKASEADNTASSSGRAKGKMESKKDDKDAAKDDGDNMTSKNTENVNAPDDKTSDSQSGAATGNVTDPSHSENQSKGDDKDGEISAGGNDASENETEKKQDDEEDDDVEEVNDNDETAKAINKLPPTHIRGVMSTLIGIIGPEAQNKKPEPLPPIPKPQATKKSEGLDSLSENNPASVSGRKISGVHENTYLENGITTNMLAEALIECEKRNLMPNEIGRDAEKPEFYCKLCQKQTTSVGNFRDHLNGKGHKAMMEAVKLGKRTPVPKKKASKIVDLGKKPICLELLADFKEPILGLSFITEYHSSSGIICVCNLCAVKFDRNIISSHMTGNKHRLSYMKEKKPNVYEHLKKFGGKKSQLSASLDELSIDCERADGRGVPVIKVYEPGKAGENSNFRFGLLNMSGAPDKTKAKELALSPSDAEALEFQDWVANEVNKTRESKAEKKKTAKKSSPHSRNIDDRLLDLSKTKKGEPKISNRQVNVPQAGDKQRNSVIEARTVPQNATPPVPSSIHSIQSAPVHYFSQPQPSPSQQLRMQIPTQGHRHDLMPKTNKSGPCTSQNAQKLEPRSTSQSGQKLEPRPASQSGLTFEPRSMSQSRQKLEPRPTSQSGLKFEPRSMSQSGSKFEPRSILKNSTLNVHSNQSPAESLQRAEPVPNQVPVKPIQNQEYQTNPDLFKIPQNALSPVKKPILIEYGHGKVNTEIIISKPPSSSSHTKTAADRWEEDILHVMEFCNHKETSSSLALLSSNYSSSDESSPPPLKRRENAANKLLFSKTYLEAKARGKVMDTVYARNEKVAPDSSSYSAHNVHEPPRYVQQPTENTPQHVDNLKRKYDLSHYDHSMPTSSKQVKQEYVKQEVTDDTKDVVDLDEEADADTDKIANLLLQFTEKLVDTEDPEAALQALFTDPELTKVLLASKDKGTSSGTSSHSKYVHAERPGRYSEMDEKSAKFSAHHSPDASEASDRYMARPIASPSTTERSGRHAMYSGRPGNEQRSHSYGRHSAGYPENTNASARYSDSPEKSERFKILNDDSDLMFSGYSRSPIKSERDSQSRVQSRRFSRSPVKYRYSQSPVKSARSPGRMLMKRERYSRSPVEVRRNSSPIKRERFSRSPVMPGRYSRSPVKSGRYSRSPVKYGRSAARYEKSPRRSSKYHRSPERLASSSRQSGSSLSYLSRSDSSRSYDGHGSDSRRNPSARARERMASNGVRKSYARTMAMDFADGSDGSDS